MEIVKDPLAALTAEAIESALDELGGRAEAGEFDPGEPRLPPTYFHNKASSPPGAAMSRSAIARLRQLLGAANRCGRLYRGREGRP